MIDRIAIHATIHGRVQGVWYRAWTQENARARGLSGWVRNAPDGTVVALFVGPREQVDEMLTACREGPANARVDRIETRKAEAVPDMADFEVRR